MIEFRETRKTYISGHRQVSALDGVTLTLEKGEFTAILGASGSGKSTLLHLAGGLDTPSSGEVWIAGQSTSRMTDTELALLRRTNIGFVFQFFNLLPTLSVMENASLPALLSGKRFTDVRPGAEALLARVGLSDRLSHLPEELSGGEMQRVAIARALINDPPVLLADEPTGNLDSATGRSILHLLQELCRDKTLVMVTHDAAISLAADRTIRLLDGRVVEDQHARPAPLAERG